MNNARRTKIEKLNNRLSEIMDLINELANEEQEAFDNMPESIQYGERGEKMEDYISTIDDAIGNLDTEALQDIVDGY